jgi:RecA/RadA recombinase
MRINRFIAGASLLVFYLARGAFAGAAACIPWLFLALACWLTVDLIPHPKGPVVMRFGGLKWRLEDFVRGWLITGRTGSGKTQAAINAITFQLFKHVKGFGAVCLDQKGLYWEILVRMASFFHREEDLILLQVRPAGAPYDWKPKYTINLTGNPDIPASTYAKTIVDTASSLSPGASKGNIFFTTKAQLAIEVALRIARYLRYACTIPVVYSLLLDKDDQAVALDKLEHGLDKTSRELLIEYRDNYLGQPPEQLGGVQGTIHNYLAYFLDRDIAEVFCDHDCNFDINEIDQGKIVCLAMPQKFQTERLYINTMMKLSYYFHALCRFDKTEAERRKDNLLVLFADEGQEVITGAESAFADHRMAGVIREAKATIVLATQAYTSILGALDPKHAKVFFVNMANEIIFQVADDESAKMASKRIGEREITEKSWGYSRGHASYNFSKKIKAFIEPYVLRGFRKFEAVVCHAELGYKRMNLIPITPEGKIPGWYQPEH